MNDHQKRTAPDARPGLLKGKKEKDFPATKNSPSGLETQARAACPACSFYRAIDLPSGRVRRLCMLTGERLTAADAATGCGHFLVGRWEAVWADPDAPRQGMVCALCRNAVASTRRAVMLGATVCRLHRPEARRGAPVHCPALRTRRAEGVRHAA